MQFSSTLRCFFSGFELLLVILNLWEGLLSCWFACSFYCVLGKENIVLLDDVALSIYGVLFRAV